MKLEWGSTVRRTLAEGQDDVQEVLVSQEAWMPGATAPSANDIKKFNPNHMLAPS